MNFIRDYIGDVGGSGRGGRGKRILVLGAGVVGLNTALKIQEDMPDALVTVRAEKFCPDTTSNVAAGIFRPSPAFRAPTEELGDFWMGESWKYLQGLRKTEGAKATGIIEVPMYLLSSGDTPAHAEGNRVEFLARNATVHRECTQRELDLFQPRGHWRCGTYSHTLVVDCARYLPFAEERLRARGGTFEKGRVEKLEDLEEEGRWDLVVNCTGFGAKQLCRDKQMTANRGQVMKVHAPWIKVAVYADPETIVIPGVDAVTVGRTIELYNTKMRPSEHDRKGIWDRATKVIPSLKRATVVRDAVGIRPTRTSVRVEKELVGVGLRVVHNYGHCGYGVMSSWGSAVTASKLAAEALAGDMENRHLGSSAVATAKL